MTMKRSLFLVLGLCLSLPAFSATPDAARLLAAGRADDVVRLLTQRVAANSNDPAAYNLLCRAQLMLEEWNPAADSCERAATLAPAVSLYQFWLGRAYGHKAEHAGKFSAFGLARKSLAAMQRAVELDPKSAPARRDLAEYYATAPGIVGGGSDKALRLADEVAARDPLTAALIRGLVAEKGHNPSEAERQYQEAVRLSGNSAAALVELAHFYRTQSNWQAMETTLQRAVDSPRQQPIDLYKAGEMLVGSGRNLKLAVDVLRKYLAGRGDEDGPVIRAHCLLGKALEGLGDRNGAASEYRAALALAAGYRPAQDALHRLGL